MPNMSYSNELPLTFCAVPVPTTPSTMGTGVPKKIEEVLEAFKEIKISARLENQHKGDPYLVLEPEQLLQAAEFLRDNERFSCTMLRVISATDYPPQEASAPGVEPVVVAQAAKIKVTYVFFSFQHRHQIILALDLDRDHAEAPSLAHLYRGANWYERECYDMNGVLFKGHPHLKRVLLPPDWVGHPLRKDYVFPEEYNGMKVPL